MVDKERIVEQTIERASFTRKLTLVEKPCVQCGKIFEGAKVAKYCSRECQNKAYYERSADERRAKRREAYQKKKGQPQDPKIPLPLAA